MDVARHIVCRGVCIYKFFVFCILFCVVQYWNASLLLGVTFSLRVTQSRLTRGERERERERETRNI